MSPKFHSMRAVTFDTNSCRNLPPPFRRDRKNLQSCPERNHVPELDDMFDQSFFADKIALCTTESKHRWILNICFRDGSRILVVLLSAYLPKTRQTSEVYCSLSYTFPPSLQIVWTLPRWLSKKKFVDAS